VQNIGEAHTKLIKLPKISLKTFLLQKAKEDCRFFDGVKEIGSLSVAFTTCSAETNSTELAISVEKELAGAYDVVFLNLVNSQSRKLEIINEMRYKAKFSVVCRETPFL